MGDNGVEIFIDTSWYVNIVDDILFKVSEVCIKLASMFFFVFAFFEKPICMLVFRLL